MIVGQGQTQEILKLQTPNEGLTSNAPTPSSTQNLKESFNPQTTKQAPSAVNENGFTFAEQLNSMLGRFETNTSEFDFSIIGENLGIDGLNATSFAEIQNIDTLEVTREDAQFFVNMTQGTQTSVQNIGNDLKVVQTEKAMEVSKTLVNLLEKAHNTQKPIRLDFDNNITLVLKVNNQGVVNAAFFPSDTAAEQYLRNNIPYLKHELDAKNISYGSLNYFSRQKNNQKEKDNE
ncbi:hypothetical protein IJC60_05560 [bacterium]|nr:hypothetical protein [bacterium]